LLPVSFLSAEIIAPANDALHACKPLLPAVKTGQPRVLSLSIALIRLQRYKLIIKKKI